MMLIPGGNDCFNRVALSWSVTLNVYKYFEHLTLNFVTEPVFLILTDFASLRLAFNRKSLISAICFGCLLRFIESKRERENVSVSKIRSNISFKSSSLEIKERD
jgi:hypothetical protein